MRILFITLLFLTTGFSSAFAADDGLQAKVEAAMKAEGRPEADVARDRNRRPAETLEFFQMRDDMRVLELVPGGGWYTRILAPVLRDKGSLYVAIGAERIAEGFLKEPAFDKVKVVDVTFETTRDGPFRTRNVKPFELGVNNMDLVLTFRNLHNFTAEGRALINAQAFKSLKSGGLYGVVDHTQRHMEQMSNESRRRLDPMLMVKEIQSAGFVMVDYSDVHYKPDDELRYEVGRASVTGNTDRFTILFRKP